MIDIVAVSFFITFEMPLTKPYDRSSLISHCKPCVFMPVQFVNGINDNNRLVSPISLTLSLIKNISCVGVIIFAEICFGIFSNKRTLQTEWSNLEVLTAFIMLISFVLIVFNDNVRFFFKML